MRATSDASRLAKMLEDCGGPQRGDAPQPEKLTPSETAQAATAYLNWRSYISTGGVLSEPVTYTLSAMPRNIDLGVDSWKLGIPEGVGPRQRIDRCLRDKYHLPLTTVR